jgi:drug/metabolite transporter (DMT)-like permease
VTSETSAAGRQVKGLTAIFAAACIWGLSGPYYRWISSHGIGVFLNNVISCSTAVIALAAYGAAVKLPFYRIKRRHLLALIPHSFGSIITSYTMFHAFRLTTVANTVLLHYLTPIFVAIISVPLFGERLTWLKIAALFVSMTGMTLVVSAGSSGLAAAAGRGELLAFVSSLSYTGSIVAARYLRDLNPLTTAFYNNLFVAVISSVFLLISPPEFPGFQMIGAAAAAGGLLGSVLSMTLYFFALKNADASRVSIVALMEVAIAAIMGIVLFRENLSLQLLLGGVLIMGGCMIVAGEKGER